MTLRCDPEYNFIFFRTLETSHPQVTESPFWFEIADLAAGPIDAQLAAWRALSEADPAAVDHLGLLQLDLLHSFLPTFRISSPMNCFLTGVVACLYRWFKSWHYYFWCNTNNIRVYVSNYYY